MIVFVCVRSLLVSAFLVVGLLVGVALVDALLVHDFRLLVGILPRQDHTCAQIHFGSFGCRIVLRRDGESAASSNDEHTQIPLSLFSMDENTLQKQAAQRLETD